MSTLDDLVDAWWVEIGGYGQRREDREPRWRAHAQVVAHEDLRDVRAGLRSLSQSWESQQMPRPAAVRKAVAQARLDRVAKTHAIEADARWDQLRRAAERDRPLLLQIQRRAGELEAALAPDAPAAWRTGPGSTSGLQRPLGGMKLRVLASLRSHHELAPGRMEPSQIDLMRSLEAELEPREGGAKGSPVDDRQDTEGDGWF